MAPLFPKILELSSLIAYLSAVYKRMPLLGLNSGLVTSWGEAPYRSASILYIKISVTLGPALLPIVPYGHVRQPQ